MRNNPQNRFLAGSREQILWIWLDGNEIALWAVQQQAGSALLHSVLAAEPILFSAGLSAVPSMH